MYPRKRNLGGCDYEFCPYCERPVDPVKEAEGDESTN